MPVEISERKLKRMEAAEETCRAYRAFIAATIYRSGIGAISRAGLWGRRARLAITQRRRRRKKRSSNPTQPATVTAAPGAGAIYGEAHAQGCD